MRRHSRPAFFSLLCASLAPVALGVTLAAPLAGCVSTTDHSAAALDHPDALMRLGATSLGAQDFPAAAGFYARAITTGGDSPAARVGLGSALLGNEDPRGALQQFEMARTLKPHDADADLGIGRVYLAEHKPAEALAAFQLAERDGSRDPALYNNEGIAFDYLQRHEEAQAAYRLGLASSPDDRSLLSNYGLSLALSGKYPESIRILTDLAQEPDATPRMRQNLALALGMSGDKEAARRVSAHDLDPEAVENNLRYYSAMRGS